MQKEIAKGNLYRELTGRSLDTGGPLGMLASMLLLAMLTGLLLAAYAPRWLDGSAPLVLPAVVAVWIVAGLVGWLTEGQHLTSHQQFLNDGGAMSLRENRGLTGGRWHIQSDVPESGAGCLLAVLHFFCGNIYLGARSMFKGSGVDSATLEAALKGVEILNLNGKLANDDLLGTLKADYPQPAVHAALKALVDRDLASQQDGQWTLTRRGRELFPSM